MEKMPKVAKSFDNDSRVEVEAFIRLGMDFILEEPKIKVWESSC